MRIGVFDSGAGGLSVAWAIQKAFPDVTVDYASDTKNVPYGDKTPEEMVRVSLEVLRPLAETSDVIVVACNSLTTNGIDRLRQELDVPLIGIEPMVKPATVRTRTGIITICATPATLRSERYQFLKRQYAKGMKILEPDCSQWARMIESNQIERKEIASLIDDVCGQGSDVIVLGCTHYHWIEKLILESANGRAIVLQPEAAIVKQLGVLLAGLGQPA